MGATTEDRLGTKRSDPAGGSTGGTAATAIGAGPGIAAAGFAFFAELLAGGGVELRSLSRSSSRLRCLDFLLCVFSSSSRRGCRFLLRDESLSDGLALRFCLRDRFGDDLRLFFCLRLESDSDDSEAELCDRSVEELDRDRRLGLRTGRFDDLAGDFEWDRLGDVEEDREDCRVCARDWRSGEADDARLTADDTEGAGAEGALEC